jgi:MoaA/NifB/PqqE/SkfB family radical SAM enzyme
MGRDQAEKHPGPEKPGRLRLWLGRLKFWAVLARAVGLMLLKRNRRRKAAAKPLRLIPFLARRVRFQARRSAELGVPVPHVCMFSVTWRCNLHCAGCYAANYERGADLSRDQIDRVLREAIDLGTYMFVIVGGEPLMVEGLIGQLSRTRDALFFLFTNGTLVGDEHVAELEAARNIVPVVSFEGTREEMELRRGPAAYRGAVEAMERFRAAGILYGVAAMVTRRNVRTVVSREWFDSIWARGARLAVLLDYVPMPFSADPELVLTEEDRRLKRRMLRRRFAEARPIVVNFPPDEYRYGGCRGAGRGFIHVNADGYVEPCPFSHYAAGNVLTEPLAEILAAPFMSELRQKVAGWDNPTETCLLAAHSEEVEALVAATGGFCTERRSGKP